jgi:inhibitor of cysteine peptidase
MPADLLALYHARPAEESPETFCRLNPRRERAYKSKKVGSDRFMSTSVWRGCFGLALLVSLASAAAAAALMILTEQDNGGHVAARTGDELVLRLPENISTGYRWAVDDASPKILELENARSEPAPAAAVGAGGDALFRFRVVGGGSGKLSLKYWRQWEGDASIVKRFAVTVEAAK